MNSLQPILSNRNNLQPRNAVSANLPSQGRTDILVCPAATAAQSGTGVSPVFRTADFVLARGSIEGRDAGDDVRGVSRGKFPHGRAARATSAAASLGAAFRPTFAFLAASVALTLAFLTPSFIKASSLLPSAMERREMTTAQRHHHARHKPLSEMEFHEAILRLEQETITLIPETRKAEFMKVGLLYPDSVEYAKKIIKDYVEKAIFIPEITDKESPEYLHHGRIFLANTHWEDWLKQRKSSMVLRMQTDTRIN